MHFPKTHLLLIAVLSFALVTMVMAKFGAPAKTERFSEVTTLSDLNASLSLSEQFGAEADNLSTSATSNTAAEPLAMLPAEAPIVPAVVAQEERWEKITSTVRPGDNLALIFKRNKLTPQEVHAVSTSKPLGKRLRNIYPGHELQLFVDDEHRLMQLRYATGPLNTLVYKREGDTFISEQITEQPERMLAYKHATIDHSLFVASQRAGLSDNLTMRLAQIFQWDVDFVLDIRPGDAFYVLFEELYHNGEFIGFGDILAAEFVNQGDHHRAIMYTNANGERDYFAPNGESMRKAFLRAPVAFSRISSNFNLRRVHPLWKTARPHRGIDYAAPRNTPILAAGDGRVTTASRNKANGNYVVIQHGEQFVTKYLHMSKFGKNIKRGAKVRQGQTIGYVGATGWATGPHLHYEFLVNGVHQNPRTVSLPDAQPIAGQEFDRFRAHTEQYSVLLDNYKNQVTVALAR